MRLTLRTLLAYLDDTLEPAEAKLIGQKVAESDTARDLIARIKEVTRKRRLTSPGDGPGTKVDANTIAEYLDNELTPEALAKLEEVALASEVHLAEIAACHQILTVVLGEPAVVPPTAYRRMYGLVKSKASNPYQAPPQRREIEEGLYEGKEVDETLRLGLPALRGGSTKNRIILLAGAAGVLLLLGVAILVLLSPWLFNKDEGNVAKAPTDRKIIAPTPKTTPKVNGNGGGKKDTSGKGENTVQKPAEEDKQPVVKEPIPAEKKTEDEPPAPPNTAIVAIGQFEPQKEVAVLLQKVPDKAEGHWTRVVRTKEPARVLANAPLVSLPGYRSVIQMDSGAKLTLWGNMPEIWPFPVAFESVVMLHPNTRFDLDLTLIRGRIAVNNPKDEPLKVRLRFTDPSNPDKDQVWDITLLEKGSEVFVNLESFFLPGRVFNPKKEPDRLGPLARVVMAVKAGSAELLRDLQPVEKLTAPPKGSLVRWTSKQGRPDIFKIDSLPPWVQALPPLPEGMDIKVRKAVQDALDSLTIDLSGPNLENGFASAMQGSDSEKRRLVVRSAGARDDLAFVIDALHDKEIGVRRAAIETLRIWIGARRDNDFILFADLQSRFTPSDAVLIMELLHIMSPTQAADTARQDLLVARLTHNKIEVRELAHDNLLMLFPSGNAIGYNAAAPEAQFRQAAAQWKTLVEKFRK